MLASPRDVLTPERIHRRFIVACYVEIGFGIEGGLCIEQVRIPDQATLGTGPRSVLDVYARGIFLRSR